MEKAYYEMVEGPHRGYCASLKKKKNKNKLLCIEGFKGEKMQILEVIPNSWKLLPLQVNPRAQKINIQEH